MNALRTGTVLAGAAVGGVGLSIGPEMRLRRSQRPLTDEWERVPVEARGATRLGISFRPLQAQEFHLRASPSPGSVTGLPLRTRTSGGLLGRYGNGAWVFRPERAGLASRRGRKGRQVHHHLTGAVKAFGYPEYFVQEHQAGGSIPEGPGHTDDAPRTLAGAANSPGGWRNAIGAVPP